jgi:hypothetical protein
VSTGPAAPPPAAENGSQPGAEQQPQENADPWTSTLEGVDEVYRPHVEQAINPLREQLSPQLELADRLGPLGDYADDLLALHGMADDDGNALEDFLGFAAMASQVDPENPDSEANQAFADWFYEIGERMGLIDPEDGGDPDSEDGEDYEGEEETGEAAALREQLQAMQATIERLEAQPRVQAEQQRIDAQVNGAIKEHGLVPEGAKEEDVQAMRNTILRFARDYVEQPNMIDLAVKDVLTLTGGAQRGLLNGAETETVSPAGVSPGNGSPDLHPEDLTTGDPTATRRAVKQAAMSRLRAAG